jgi:hypothetical protein
MSSKLTIIPDNINQKKTRKTTSKTTDCTFELKIYVPDERKRHRDGLLSKPNLCSCTISSVNYSHECTPGIEQLVLLSQNSGRYTNLHGNLPYVSKRIAETQVAIRHILRPYIS